MKRHDRRGDRGRRGPRYKARPQVEGLEARALLYAAVSGPWPHPNMITYSIVPDGTSIGGYPSNLIASFNSRWSTPTWASLITEAAAIWEQVANINLVPVADNGAAMGTGPDEQGAPNMGDIRISGLPSSVLGTGTLAYTLYPPPANGDSSSGDIIFNTSQAWAINNDYDLLTVAIHEFGHALGLGESLINQAAMEGTYIGINQQLAPDDIAGIDSIYGLRQADMFEAAYNNTTSTNAANLTPYFNSLGQFADAPLDIQAAGQAEWFKVTVPSNASNTMLVTMQASGLSLLSPAVALYTSSMQNLAVAANYNVPSGNVSITLNGIVPGQVYYIQAFGYGVPAYSDGSYGLEINFNSKTNPLGAIASPVTTTANQPSQGGGGGYEATGLPGGSPVTSWLARLDGDLHGGQGGGNGQGSGNNGQGDGDRQAGGSQIGSTAASLLLPASSQPSRVAISLGSSAPAGPWQQALEWLADELGSFRH